jgi:hypothetical protein
MEPNNLIDGVAVPLTAAEAAELEGLNMAWTYGAAGRAMSALRAERNTRLSACDWTQVADAPVDQAAWAVYRQTLRDYPETVVDPANPPAWPIAPGP